MTLKRGLSFVADDTIEIREIIPANSGRDAVPCFLRRQKLPRTIASIPLPGVVTDRTLLNVFGHPQRGGHYILDSLKVIIKEKNETFHFSLEYCL